MTIGVVVSCYRPERFLARTVATIERALEGCDWQGVLEVGSPTGAPLPALSSRWRVVCAYDERTQRFGRPPTPGGGRMLGFAEVGGEWVLFADPDVELDREWTRAAIALAESRPELGAIFGRIEEWFEDHGVERPGHLRDMYLTGDVDRPVDYLATLSFYRRTALAAAGGYDPRLHSEEDFELGLRFQQLGIEMWSLGRLAARHWSDPRPTFRELARRWRSGFCFGQGEVLRLYAGRPGFGTLLARQRLNLAALAMWALGTVAAIASVALRDPRPFAAWLVVPATVIAGMGLRKRSLRMGALSLAAWTVNGFGAVVGFFRMPGDARPLGPLRSATC